MKAFDLSIRQQLLAWILIPFSALWIVFGVLTYYFAIDLTNYGYDRSLADSVRYLAGRLRVTKGTVKIDLPPDAEAAFREDPQDKEYFKVLDGNGALLCGDVVIPSNAMSKVLKEPMFSDGKIEAMPVRIATMTWPIPNSQRKFALIQVAETLIQRNRLKQRILATVVIPELLTVLLTTCAIYLGVNRGLAPLRLVQDAVACRSQSDLSPLSEEQAPKEVRQLVSAINDLFKRLQLDIEAQRRFVANAAHQLKTPLAGLKTQIQLTLRQPRGSQVEHSLQKIHTSADRCARLVHQLLVLAKVEPDAIDRTKYGTLDLNNIARNATEEVVQDAIAKNIDVGFEGTDSAARINGDALSLYELVFNLVENAVRYTQPGGKVTVRVTSDATTCLSVEDNGPGIPLEERQRVFERFYRILGTGATGSGLGLAIVYEIANAHGARVSLSEGSLGIGTLITVKFPKPTVEIPPRATSIATI